MKAYLEELSGFPDAEIIVVEHADVGTAVDALACKDVKWVQVHIILSSMENPLMIFKE